MPIYAYVAVDRRGQESTGSIDADSINDAVDQIRQSGFFPTKVSEEKPLSTDKSLGDSKAETKRQTRRSGSIVLFQRKSVKPKTLMIFTRQLATLINAGLPLLRGLEVLAKQERDPVLKNTITRLATSVQDGSTFSEGLARHSRIFDDLVHQHG